VASRCRRRSDRKEQKIGRGKRKNRKGKRETEERDWQAKKEG
jgi:hypothetical protein